MGESLCRSLCDVGRILVGVGLGILFGDLGASLSIGIGASSRFAFTARLGSSTAPHARPRLPHEAT
jgi:hypothetical protein